MTKAGQTDPDERILWAAGKLFREKGFAATTVREVASLAGMLPGSLHYRYPSKDELLVALMRRGIQRAMAAVREATAQERDPVERVRLALRAHLELLCSGDDSLYVLLFDWRSLGKSARRPLERERGRYEVFWDGLLAEAFASGRTRPGTDLGLLRRLGFGAINWVATWYAPGEPSPRAIADAFFDAMAFGLIDPARPSGGVDGAGGSPSPA